MLKFRDILNTKLNKKGFTLAELLVVVAILAILVAVSIPIFTGRLTEAKKATDAANVRAAKAVAVSEYLSDGTTGEMKYDAETGTMISGTPANYGKIAKGYVIVTVTETNGDVSLTTKWSEGGDADNSNSEA